MQLNINFLNICSFIVILLFYLSSVNTLKQYTKKDILKFREEVRQMFNHAYGGYLKYASEYDELRPLSCDGIDTWGSYSLTLIDALDTLAVMGNYSEFRRVVKILTEKINFDKDINVSVFETNIRIVGGLLSAHLMSHRAGIDLEPGWPCNGPLLRLAEDVARRILPAFDTKTGMPYGTVNLRNGVPPGETTITCTAGVGTFIVEFGALSRLTGDPIYEEVALNAIYALWRHRSPIGLFGNHIDVQTGRWTAQDSGIGAGIDSFYEYLVKGAIMLNRPDLLEMFHEGRKAIDKYLKKDDWYFWVGMNKGQVTLPVFQSLEAYWPGVLSLIGDTNSAMRTLLNYHQVWKQYGFLPEFYNIPNSEAGENRESYPLRPELIESIMYLHRATKDPSLLAMGVDILYSIQYSAKTPCGYATIKNVKTHQKDDRMESFFLAETTKYLYLLFDPDNFLHNDGSEGTIFETPNGECIIEAGGYIFNTEAHPIDPSALHCCYNLPQQNDIFADFKVENYIGEIFEKRPVVEEKYKCKQKSLKHMEGMIVNIEAEFDPSIIDNPSPSVVEDNVKTKPILSDLELNDDNEYYANETNNNLWTELEELLILRKNRKSLSSKDNEKMLHLITRIMKNTQLKEKDSDSNVEITETLFKSYETEVQLKIVMGVLLKLLLYQKTKYYYESIDIASNLLFDSVLKVISAVKNGEEETLNQIQLDIWNIMLEVQANYENLFNNQTQMILFMLTSDNYKSVLKDTKLSDLILENVSFLTESNDTSKSVNKSKNLNLKYFEQVGKIIYTYANYFNLSSIKDEMKIGKNDNNKHGMINVIEQIFLTFTRISKEINIENSRIDEEINRYSDNDDIIVVEKGPHENNHIKETDENIGIGSVEPMETDLSEIEQKSEINNLPKIKQYPTIISANSEERDTISNIEKTSNILTNFVNSVLKNAFPDKPKFDPQLLLQKIRSKGEYLNYTKNFELFTCKTPSFLQRLCSWGEVL